MNKRIQQLLEFLKEDPNDPFTLYALALEFLPIDNNKSREFFETLLDKHENYVGTYYHAAQLYTELDLLDKAKEVYEKGIMISEKQANAHALKELKSAYQNFLFENM